MANQTAETFINALHSLETNGRLDELVALFSENCELENLAATTPVKGRDSAHQFWGNYYAAFQQIQSEFTRLLEADDFAVLEWTARGLMQDGNPIEYRGVTILEFAQGKVQRLQTYYDTAAFLTKYDWAARHAAGNSGAQAVS